MKVIPRAVAVTLLVVLGVMLVGCTGTTTPPATNTALSGRLIDRSTGAGVSGLTVDFGARTTTTGGDGSYKVDFGGSEGASGTFCVHGSGYATIYATPISLSAGRETHVTTIVEPLGAPATHQVTIKVLDSSSIEIAAGTMMSYSIFNSAGGSNNNTYQYPYTTGGLVVGSPTFGNDCLVAAMVYAATPFNVMKDQVDLSASSTTVTLTQDSGAATTAVNAIGDTSGNAAALSFLTPYGAYLASSGQLAGSPPTAAVPVTNPYGYGGSWMQLQRTVGYLGSGFDKFVGSIASTTAIGTSVSLPSLNTSVGPNVIADANSIAYSGGTVSISPVSGANLYIFILYDSTADAPAGRFYSASESLTLPSWLQAQLSTHNVDVRVVPIGTNAVLGLSKLEAFFCVVYMRVGHGGLPVEDGMQFGVLTGSDFQKTLTF